MVGLQREEQCHCPDTVTRKGELHVDLGVGVGDITVTVAGVMEVVLALGSAPFY